MSDSGEKRQESKSGGLEDLVPRFKAQGYSRDKVDQRRRWLEEKTDCRLEQLGDFTSPTDAFRGNIENPVGVAQLPLGVAGPLLLQGDHARGIFYLPLATTEGALVRSYERGMVALTRGGGVEACVSRDQNQVNPSFFLPTIQQARRFADWVVDQLSGLKEVAESTTRHGELKSVTPYVMGRQVILRFRFGTGDAQGMNMIVKATDHACRWITEQFTDAARFHVFSGMSSEKRASGYLLAEGKGKWVSAEGFLPSRIVKSYLNCSPEELYEVWLSTTRGQILAQAVGNNGQLANGLSAMFIALGQDVANVANSSCGVTTFELEDQGIRVGLTLPALSVATVGGGTGLPTQRECLEMIGCYGDGRSLKLAELVGGALLAGEVSMAAAIASGDFVGAHELYGRNRPAGDRG